MIIHSDYEYQIGDCGNLIDASSNQKLVVVANRDGHLMIIHVGRNHNRKKISASINSISLHPTLPIIAIAQADGKIQIIDDQCTLLKLLDIPSGLTGYTANDCQFDCSGNNLWIALSNYTKKAIICRVTSDNWIVETQTQLQVPFDEYDIKFDTTHNFDTVSIWIGAGTEGQQVYWASAYKDVEIFPVTELRNTCPPIFSPNGDEFLILKDEYAILRYRYSDLSLLGVCRLNSDDVNISFEYGNHFYTDDQTAIVTLDDGRSFAMDLATMKMGEEIIFNRHEPFPISDDGKQLYTDILGLYRFGSMVITQHNLNRHNHHFGHCWKEAILIHSISQFNAN